MVESSQDGTQDRIAQPQRPLPAIQDACTLCGRELPIPAELVSGILHQGAKLSFSGASKGFKTWTLDALALAVAYGVPWLGYATKQARVLLIDLELQEAFCRRRLVRLQEAMEIKATPGKLDVWGLRGFTAAHTELLPRIEAQVTAARYGLIIIDPIYKLYGAGTSENAASDVAMLMNGLERLTVATNAAIAFAAHYSKGNQAGKSSIDRVSGSGVFARDPDSLLTLTAHEQPDCFTLEATLRNHAPADPVVLKWRYPMFKRVERLDPGALQGQRKARRKKYNPDNLLSTLQDGMSAIEWQKASGVSQHPFEHLRRILLDEGKVRCTNHKWWNHSTIAQ